MRPSCSRRATPAGQNGSVSDDTPDTPAPHALGPAAAAGPAQPPLPRWATAVSIGSVWAIALVLGILIASLSRPTAYASWLSLALAVCALLSFVAQLATQEKDGFVTRLAATLTGAFVILGVIGGLLALVARVL